MNKTTFLKLIFLLFWGCCACSNADKNTSGKVLPVDSVATILADCFFTESEIYVQQWKNDVNPYSFLKYDSLFEKHGLTKEIFAENVKFYITSEKLSDKFINRVGEIVEKRTAVLRDSLELEQ